MAQSMNSTVEYTARATSYHGIGVYGDMMMGNNALEFYNARNVEDFIQIPWTEITHVAAEVLFGGRVIPRFAVFVKGSEKAFSFSCKDNKAALRIIRDHIGNENVVRSPSFLDVIRHGFIGIWKLITRKG